MNLNANRGAGERGRERAAEWASQASRSVREIGPLPAVVDARRRARCRDSLADFCKTYEAGTFDLPWSPDHLSVICTMERAIRDGGQFALAMPRGSGKTSLCIAGCAWALVYGYHRFVLMVGATETAAYEMLQSLRASLGENELLLADFPEVCFPISKLDGIAHRCNGQILDGKRTKISWTSKELVLPTVPGSAASGAIVRTAGIDGRIRGHQRRTDAGVTRPSLVIVDDPQTRETARSRGPGSQSAQREKILAGDVLYAGRPKTKIAALMPCTVIYRSDMADNILSRDLHPEWQGMRTKFLYAFPADMARWDYYATLRADGLRAEVGLAWATSYYEQYRAEMDSGASVAWAERYEPDELSAIQHAMNAWYKDKAAFMAEYQNEPMDESEESSRVLAEKYLAERCTADVARGIAPAWADAAIVTIDVGQYRLHWEVSAWNMAREVSAMIDCGIKSTDVDRDGALSQVRDNARRASMVERAIVSALCRLRERFAGIPRVGSEAPIMPRFGVDVGGTSSGATGDEGAAWSSAIMSHCRGSGATWYALKGARWTDGHRKRAGERNVAHSERGFWETNADHFKAQLFAAYQRPLTGENGGMCDGSRGFFGGLKDAVPDYLAHQRSEAPDTRGHWDKHSEPGRGRVQNHWWDTAYMQFAVAEIVRLQTGRRRVQYGVIGRAWK